MSVRAVGLFMLLILLICVACTGCAVTEAGHPIDGSLLYGVSGAFVAVAAVAVMFAYGVFSDYWKPGLLFLVLAGVMALAGCAALPMPLQPENEQYNSNHAEGGFIVLAAIDTAQTMHIRRGSSCDHEADPIAAALYGSKYPKPGRVLLTNLALITVHTMVTSWLDDEVARHDSLHDDSVGLWYVGRVVWHGASLFAEGAAVASNASRGCAL